MEVEKLNWNRGKLANEIVAMCLREVKMVQTCQVEELNPLRIDQIVSKELEYIREDLQKVCLNCLRTFLIKLFLLVFTLTSSK